jgi:hypothetical protein
VVGRFAVFHWTTEVGTKLLPVTVRVKAGPPAVVEVGERLAFVGEGLLIVRVSALVEGTPLVTTVTWAVPARAMSVAGIAAVTRVARTKVVVRLLPFHCTIDPVVNPDPFTVRVKAAPPAVREVGLMLVSVAASAGPKGSRVVRKRSRHPASMGRPDHRNDRG